jgi:putative chitinase
MVAALDRAVFYASARPNPFPGSLTPAQVTGMEAILDAALSDLGLNGMTRGGLMAASATGRAKRVV